MFNIGDYVTRISYNNDIIFQIVNIKDNIYYLRGVNLRLYADSFIGDLKKIKKDLLKDDFNPDIFEYKDFDRNDFFYLPGKVLHLDGDREYLQKCMKFYKKNNVNAYGIYLKESDMLSNISNLLVKYNPDILVITGHDSFSKGKVNGYINTSHFVKTVKQARLYNKNLDELFIIAGACQSNYEDLIKSGANFASSPKGVNVHALDPAIIASCISFSDVNKKIDVLGIIKKTKYASFGFGGIITNGSMYMGYPRK